MKKIKTYFYTLGFLLTLTVLSSLTGCGSASPPASIPAPVASLMVASAPSSTGAVTISGAPGAIPTPVDAGATVQAQNCTQTICHLFRKLLIRSAWAQILSAEVPVQPDGSFNNLQLDVIQPTDRIGLRQSTPNGVSSFIQIQVPCGGPNPPCVAL